MCGLNADHRAGDAAARQEIQVEQYEPVLNSHVLLRAQAARPPGPRIARQLAILSVRAWELADRVAAGEIEFIDAVDMAYSSAVWSGLVAAAGDDAVQAALVQAFDGVRPT